MAYHLQVYGNKEEKDSFMNFRGTVVKEMDSLDEIVTFPWLSFGSLSLAELLLGKEASVPPAEEVKSHCFLSGIPGMSFPVGVSSVL